MSVRASEEEATAREEAAAVEGATAEPKAAHARDGHAERGHTTFLLIRHAESEANAGGYFAGQSDSALTEKGAAQARRLNEALATITLDAVYSSDLQRARDTVAPLAELRGLPLVETRALRERSMGEFTGRSFEWVKSHHPELWRAMKEREPDAKPPGGESHRELSLRAEALVRGLREKHAGQTVALGTHGGLLHHLARALLGVTELEARFYFTSDNASVTRVDLLREGDGEVARLAYANRVLEASY